MEAITYFAQQSMKKNAPELRPGDTVRVHQRIREGGKERVQVFEGLVIAVRGNRDISSSFTVRRVASGVGVEKTFPLHSPNVLKVERIKTAKVRQARLYYMRERFGRAARMKNELWEKTTWQEPTAEELAAEAASEETPEEVVETPEVSVEDTNTEEASTPEVTESTEEVAAE